MSSPYETLGVERGADAGAIHDAYRRASKTEHPDAAKDDGARFRRLQIAYDTLRDADKRDFYDRTGILPDDATQSDPDAPAWQAIAAALANIAVMGPDIDRTDILQVVRQQLAMQTNGHRQQVAKLKHAQKRLAGALKRLKRKRGDDTAPDVLAILIEQNIANVAVQQASAEKAVKFAERIEELADRYSYKTDLSNLGSLSARKVS